MGGLGPTHPPDPFVVAQETHFFAAVATVFGSFIFHYPGYYGAIAIILVSFVKENTYDWYVEGQPWWFEKGWKNSGFVDWLFYWLGCFVSLLILAFLK